MLKASKHEALRKKRHHRTREKDPFDGTGVYAQSSRDVFSTQLPIVHIFVLSYVWFSFFILKLFLISVLIFDRDVA